MFEKSRVFYLPPVCFVLLTHLFLLYLLSNFALQRLLHMFCFKKFSREIDARPGKIYPLAHARRLTAEMHT